MEALAFTLAKEERRARHPRQRRRARPRRDRHGRAPRPGHDRASTRHPRPRRRVAVRPRVPAGRRRRGRAVAVHARAPATSPASASRCDGGGTLLTLLRRPTGMARPGGGDGRVADLRRRGRPAVEDPRLELGGSRGCRGSRAEEDHLGRSAEGGIALGVPRSVTLSRRRGPDDHLAGRRRCSARGQLPGGSRRGHRTQPWHDRSRVSSIPSLASSASIGDGEPTAASASQRWTTVSCA